MDGEMMWALLYHGHPELRLEKIPLPEVDSASVRIRPLAVGIDGTDAHVLAGEFPIDYPRVIGHEVAGVVDQVGDGVINLREGDLVCIEPHKYCGLCRYCRTGREHLCLDKKAFGFHLEGGLAEAMVVPERVAYLLPGGIDPEIGCLTEPVSCCIHGMDQLEPVSGMGLLIFGAGSAGCILIKLAKLVGLTPIVVVEPQSERREMAYLFGADDVVDPSDGEWKNKAQGLTKNADFDFVIDAVGSSQVLEDALSITARGARVLVFGVAPPNDVSRVNPYQIFRKELSIIGSAINPFTFHRAVELLSSLGLEHLAIRKFALDEYNAAFGGLGRGGKVVITPQVMSTTRRKDGDYRKTKDCEPPR